MLAEGPLVPGHGAQGTQDTMPALRDRPARVVDEREESKRTNSFVVVV